MPEACRFHAEIIDVFYEDASCFHRSIEIILCELFDAARVGTCVRDAGGEAVGEEEFRGDGALAKSCIVEELVEGRVVERAGERDWSFVRAVLAGDAEI